GREDVVRELRPGRQARLLRLAGRRQRQGVSHQRRRRGLRPRRRAETSIAAHQSFRREDAGLTRAARWPLVLADGGALVVHRQEVRSRTTDYTDSTDRTKDSLQVWLAMHYLPTWEGVASKLAKNSLQVYPAMNYLATWEEVAFKLAKNSLQVW